MRTNTKPNKPRQSLHESYIEARFHSCSSAVHLVSLAFRKISLQILRNVCKFFQILTSLYRSIQILGNVCKSLQSLTSLCKSSQILANPCEGDFLAPRAPQKKPCARMGCAWAAHGKCGPMPGGSPLELLLLARIKCVVHIGFIECVKYCYTCLKVIFSRAWLWCMFRYLYL